MKQTRIRRVTIASALAGLVGVAVAATSALPASATVRLHSAGNVAAAAKTATDVAAPPGKITVAVEAIGGIGCSKVADPPNGGVVVKHSADNTSFTIGYTDMIARAGAGVAAVDAHRNCQAAVLVTVPQGFTYAIASVDYRGTAKLAADATASLDTDYYFQGSPQTAMISHDFTGPMNGDWTRSDSTPVEALVYAPCGIKRILNVKTVVRASAQASDPTVSSLTLKKTTDSVDTEFHFAWKTCP